MSVTANLRAVVAGVLLIGSAGRAGTAPAPTLLAVWVNGHSIGKIGEFVVQGEVLAASPEELADLGLEPRVVGTGGLMEIVRESGFSWRVDAEHAVIYVTAADDRLVVTKLQPTGSNGSSQRVESATGVTLSYDLTALNTPAGTGVSGILAGRIFSKLGIVSTDALLNYGNRGPGVIEGPVRLDSAYAIAFPEEMLRLRFGDFVTSGVASARAVRLGGIQFGSDFGLRPDLITMPLPTLRGSAAVPTTADILVNGAYSSSVDVRSGPFELQNIPVVTGAGTVMLNLRDAGGNAVSRTFAYYASNALLAPGLRTFVVQMGALRHNFGLLSNDYGPWAASADYRRGLSPRLTVEGHVEFSKQTALAEAGFSANLADRAIVTQSVSWSTSAGRSGFQSISQLEHSDRVFSARLSYTAASSAFRDVAAVDGAPINRRQLEASFGVSMGGYGNVSLAYNRITTGDAPDTSLSLLTASYSIQRGPLTVYANAFASTGKERSSQFLLGLSLPFGRRDQANASIQAQGGHWQAGTQLARGTSPTERWGYQASLARGTSDSASGEVQYQSPIGWMSAGIDSTDNKLSTRMQVRGSVSAIDGAVYPSPTIANSFAVVDTAGMSGIEVYHENRPVGRTGRTGKLLIPDLRSFEVNHIAIEPTDLPADVIIATGHRDVRPQDRSGVVLRFKLKKSNAALVLLTGEKGRPIPAGSIVTLEATGATSPVGYDGEAFVEGLAALNVLSIERIDGTICKVSVRYAAPAGEIPRLGPFMCK